jgi:hypothetical protein
MTVHNPLLGRQPQRSGRVTAEMLYDHCDELNATNFVKASGKPYFVGQRTNAKGALEHFLDRRI